MSGLFQQFSNPQGQQVNFERYGEKIEREEEFQSNIGEDQQYICERKQDIFQNLVSRNKRNQISIHYCGPQMMSRNQFNFINRLATNGQVFPDIFRAGIIILYKISCQNSIKNHFYSRLRKSIRKLNKNISTLFGKQYSKFNLNIIFKISNASEGKVIGKCQVETSIQQFYKDFIYKLIDFSNQDQENNESGKVDLFQQVEDFTLSLVALQNLFRIVSGERVYKGKKKNIAYLKRFNFKLDSEAKKTLVISKENCYICDGPVNFDSQSEKGSNNQISINDIELQRDFGVYQEQISCKVSLKSHKELSQEKKTHSQELCFASAPTCDNLSYTTETQYPFSPHQSNFLDDQLKEYELTLTSDKEKWFDNLLDQYSGKKFHFDIEC